MDYLKKISNIQKDLQVEAMYLGGSRAKGFYDNYSDYDFGIVVSNEEQKNKAINAFRENFNNEIDLIKKEIGVAYHFFIEKQRLEFRLIQIDDISDIYTKIKRKDFLKMSEQDLLESVKVGRYIYKNENFRILKQKLVYPEYLKHKIISTFLDLLNVSQIDKPLKRGDRYILNKELLDLKEHIYIMSHAQKNMYISNFKHEKHILSNLSPTVTDLFTKIDNLVFYMTEEAKNELATTLEEYKKELSYEL